MSDFYQNGSITTLHKFGTMNLERLEGTLEALATQRPMALILPSLYSELEGKALSNIVKELQNVRYIRQIVITMGQTNHEQFLRAKEFFRALPQKNVLIWNDGPRVQTFYQQLEKEGLSAGPDGKGRSVWTAFGYILACMKYHGIVLHDCDIVTYDRYLLGKLTYPVMSPNLDYEFCKGFYARVTDRMMGRVVRLFVIPLIRALIQIMGRLPLLDYMDSFRYPLAGEFSMTTNLALVNRIPSDWGLEVGVLGEVFRNATSKRICQVEIADSYEHKHQPLSSDDPGKGLLKMSVDIANTVFYNLASIGHVFSDQFFKTLRAVYLRQAQDFIDKYSHDSEVNGLFFDRHQEAQAVETFCSAIELASKIIIKNPLGPPLIPMWNRVMSAIPGVLDQLKNAVDEDNRSVTPLKGKGSGELFYACA